MGPCKTLQHSKHVLHVGGRLPAPVVEVTSLSIPPRTRLAGTDWALPRPTGGGDAETERLVHRGMTTVGPGDVVHRRRRRERPLASPCLALGLEPLRSAGGGSFQVPPNAQEQVRARQVVGLRPARLTVRDRVLAQVQTIDVPAPVTWPGDAASNRGTLRRQRHREAAVRRRLRHDRPLGAVGIAVNRLRARTLRGAI